MIKSTLLFWLCITSIGWAENRAPATITRSLLLAEKGGDSVIQVSVKNSNSKEMIALELGFSLSDIFQVPIVDPSTGEDYFRVRFERTLPPGGSIQLVVKQSELKGMAVKPRRLLDAKLLRIAFSDDTVWKSNSKSEKDILMERDVAFLQIGPFIVSTGDEIPRTSILTLSIGYLKEDQSTYEALLVRRKDIQRIVIRSAQRYLETVADGDGSFKKIEDEWLSLINDQVLTPVRALKVHVDRYEPME